MYKKRVHPESELVRREWTVRLMDLPPEVLNRRKKLLRWVALSLGLISPGEERTGILDVLDALFYYAYTKGVEPTAQDILDFVNKRRIERGEKPVVLEAVRYHLRRLEAADIIEKTKGRGSTYRFTRGSMDSIGDPAAFVGRVFDDIFRSKELISEAVRHLASLYR